MTHAKKIARRTDGKMVAAQVATMQREPFQKTLVKFLQAEPTTKEIRKWAREVPDKWAQALTMVAKLVGYQEKIAIESLNVNILQGSDIGIAMRIAQIEKTNPQIRQFFNRLNQGVTIEGETE